MQTMSSLIGALAIGFETCMPCWICGEVRSYSLPEFSFLIFSEVIWQVNYRHIAILLPIATQPLDHSLS